MFRYAVVAFTLLSFTGCTTMQPIEDFSPSKIREEVHVGDEVEIVTTSGKVYALRVQEVGEDSLSGQAASGKRYKVEFGAIKTIRTARVDVARSATAGGVTLIAILTALFIAFIAALDNTMDGC